MGGSTENITYLEVDYLAAANGKTGPSQYYKKYTKQQVHLVHYVTLDAV